MNPLKLLPDWLRIWEDPAATDLRFIRPGHVRPANYAHDEEGGPGTCSDCGYRYFAFDRSTGRLMGKCLRCGKLHDLDRPIPRR